MTQIQKRARKYWISSKSRRPGNEARYMRDVFQNNRLKGRITALLDSRAALNILSSKIAESLGLQQITLGLEDFSLLDAN